MQEKARRKNILSRHRYLLTGILCLFGMVLLCAQDKKPATKTSLQEQSDTLRPPTGPQEKKKTRVDLLYADEAVADKELRPDVQVLIGSVKLRHDSMYMF